MAQRQAKYCTDRNGVRWVLLEGVINRKTQQDDPTKGQDLPVGQITGVEQTTVKRWRRSPLAWPAIYAGFVLLAFAAWTVHISWLLATPFFALALAAFYWGGKRIPGETEVIEAFQIVAPGIKREEWLIVGSHLEVKGFVEGVRLEWQETQREKEVAGKG